ncbi:hypothetical protein [Erythrobacter sp.]|uniref:hypothetical protein n=1 Tax=Erythrobacter sp. TaxID=1042 RepID=UPI0025EE4A6C|nr:hypothetical protein [Erythrobacter sp.]
MPDRRRITDVTGLAQVHVNYRDALRPIVREPLRFDIIWSDLIVDALSLVTADEIEAALLRAGKQPAVAGHVSNVLALFELTADPTEEGLDDAR